MSQEPMTVLVASYPSQELAETDWEVLTGLIRDEALELDDAAVVVTDPAGKVSVVKDLHKPVKRGLLIGALVGAITPVGLVAAIAGGGLIGKVKGMFHEGIDQATLKDIGKMLEANTAVLVIAGPPAVVDATKVTLTDATGMISQTLDETGHAVRQAVADGDEG